MTHPWQPFEITLTAQARLPNPYLDGLPEGGPPYVTATFTHPEGHRYVIPGFWDGGQTWKVRFAPPGPGRWSYTTASADPGLAGVTGGLDCAPWTDAELAENPSRRGFVRVAEEGHHFAYADGTPFLWIGDTWWPWAKKGQPFWRSKQVIDDRADRGFTVGQMMFGANSSVRLAGPDWQTLDFEAIHDAERFLTYANSRGILLWIMPWWSAQNLPEIGAERICRWARYVVHRVGAFNVLWNVGGEYNMYDYGGMGLQFWKDLGALMRAEDPYPHAIGVHNTPPTWDAGRMGDSGQWSTSEVLHDEPWLDFNGSQTGHHKSSGEMTPTIIARDYARTPAKPTLITEPWYEFIEGSAPAKDVRFAAWSALLSGAAGHTYGGGHQWWADVPDPSIPERKDTWPRPPHTIDTLDYPGAVSMGFLAKFLRSLHWWTLEPHPELVTDYPQPLCAARIGEEYLVFARYGGGLNLDLRAVSGDITYTWYDLTTSQQGPRGTLEGHSVRFFQAPDAYPRELEWRDWVLHVRKA